MKLIISIIFLIFIQSCSKPKSVMICGDHKCINKEEAKLYFEENLTIEVQIIDSRKDEILNLIELNLKDNVAEKKIFLSKKNKFNKEIKDLSQTEINNIKKEIKSRKKKKTISNTKTTSDKANVIYVKDTNKTSLLNTDIKQKINTYDVCKKISKCNIEEIAKYLIKQGKNKKFPDITTKE